MKLFKITFFLVFPLITFQSCSDDDSSNEEEQEEVKEITLEGDYSGTWNSTTDMDITYTNFAISAKFRFANADKTRLSGEFFARSSSTGDNDGTMLINLDGDSISSFSFNDTLEGCTGTFSGSGSITSKDPYTLQIDFTGNDCDGNHEGQLIFKRINN
jgi:hypothetical protein